MTLQPGSRLGPYEVVSPIGAGGMGEVYRARDTTLNRDVALKVLPEAFASDPDRLARFEREAQVLASLNHPNIAAIYGFVDERQRRALVLELVEGPTLADRIVGGPIPLDEALPIARQIADALDAAHEHGIIHRDLKPANIKVRPDGTVKVLDFGLAKALEPVAGAAHVSQSADDHESGDDAAGHGAGHRGLHESRTSEGAPGRQAQRRVGVWLRALRDADRDARVRRARDVGHDRRRPARRARLDAAPARRCRSRSPRSSIAAWRRTTSGACAISATRASSSMTRERAAAAPAIRRASASANERDSCWTDGRGGPLACRMALAATLAAWATRATPAASRSAPHHRYARGIRIPRDLASLAVSPDGLNVAFVAAVDGQPHVWVRPLDSVASRPLPGTAGASLPFWSAGQPFRRVLCGRFTQAHRSRGRVGARRWRKRSSGSVARGIATARFSWSRRQPVQSFARRLMERRRCRSLGSTANKPGHAQPHFLPDGRHFLYFVQGTPEVRGVYVGELDGPVTRKLFDADSAAVYTSGHLLFVRRARLFAQPFDVSRLEPSGDSVSDRGRCEWQSVGGRVRIGRRSARVPHGTVSVERQFVWLDRSGKEIGTVGDADSEKLFPSASPDLGQLAFFGRVNGNVDIWLLETRRGVLSRFTDHVGDDVGPVWSRDGSRIAFTSDRNGDSAACTRRARRAAGSEELLLQGQATPLRLVARRQHPVVSSGQRPLGAADARKRTKTVSRDSDGIRGTRGQVLSRWTMDRIRVQQFWSLRGLCAAVSRSWAEDTRVDTRRCSSAMAG